MTGVAAAAVVAGSPFLGPLRSSPVRTEARLETHRAAPTIGVLPALLATHLPRLAMQCEVLVGPRVRVRPPGVETS